ncbi:hypothetical protein AB0N05_18660 [Nocardia sp. NPDC051030]|uniref:hypothetical protein n=1 Tax=Nocardia sp. NPDC051030 TaxID=3155162 RepID=UPI003445EE8D
MNTQGRERRWAGPAPVGYSLALALLVTGPLLGRGYLLLRDAVSTPRSYLTDSALGLGDAAPRAVPQDALIATLSPLIDGGLLVKTILVAAIWLAGWGAASLSRELLGVSLGPQLVASTVAIWNPYVAERLLQGHWSLLTGYAALPWIALLANRLRTTAHSAPARSGEYARPRPGTARSTESTLPQPTPGTVTSGRRWEIWAALGGCLAAAGLTPTGSLLAGFVALPLVGRRNLPWTVALWIAASAPWLTATILSGAGAEPSDPAGIAAFAARAEPWLGTLCSLAGLGGIWNSTAVPDSRTTFFALVGTALLLGLVATGLRAVIGATGSGEGRDIRLESGSVGGRDGGTTTSDDGETRDGGGSGPSGGAGTGSGARVDEDVSSSDFTSGTVDGGARHSRRVLLALAVVAVVLPALGATGWGLSAGEFLVTKVPGAGLLRDTQKYVALAMPAYALCAAAGCRAVADWLAARTRDDGEALDTAVTQTGEQRSAPEARTVAQQNVEPGANAAAGWVAARPRDDNAGSDAAIARTGERESVGAGAVRTGGVAAVFIVLLLVALPDLGWGVGGSVRAVRYPAGWEGVAAAVDGPGDVAVLPGGMFRKFRWAGSAPVLDPAPRMLPNDVLQTGELPVRGGSVSGEGGRAREVEQVLLRGGSAQELADLGVGWVLVEGGTPGPVGESKNTLAQLNSVYSGGDLRLYRVPGEVGVREASAAARWVSGAAHAVWAGLLGGGILAAVSLWGSPMRSRWRSGLRSPRR